MDISLDIRNDLKLSKAKEDLKVLTKKYKEALSYIEVCESQKDVALALSKTKRSAAVTRTARNSCRNREATVISILSDVHCEAVIDAKSVNGLNSYNPEIAQRRLRNYADNLVKLTRKERQDIRIDNLVLHFGGDLINNSLHADDKLTNAMTTQEAILFCDDLLSETLESILANGEFKKIDVVCSVGNHGRCVSEDTEVLTDKGFIPVAEVTASTAVASFDPVTKNTCYSTPLALTSFVENECYYVKGHYSDERVSKDHRVFYDNELRYVQELVGKHGQGKFTTSISNPIAKAYSPEEILRLRLLTQIITDGTVVDRRIKEKVNAVRIQFHLSKPRKIERLRSLLEEMGIAYTLRDAIVSGGNVLPPKFICIYGDTAKDVWDNWLGREKRFPDSFRNLSGEGLEAVLAELCVTDGTDRGAGSVEWSSTNRSDMDIIQHACVLGGVPFRYTMSNHVSSLEGRTKYIGQLKTKGLSDRSNCLAVNVSKSDETVRFFGITTTHGTLITRRNGVVNFTGNSTMKMPTGEAAYRTSYEYIIYKNLQRKFAKESKISFQLPESYFSYLEVYGKLLRFSHGDAYRGNSDSIGSHFEKANQAIKAYHDFVGHWHALMFAPSFTRNGCTIGTTPYVLEKGYKIEPPLQSFQLLDSKRGMTINAPIFLDE